MSLNEFAVLLGGFVAAFFAGFLGTRRGDNKASGATGNVPPFSLVGPTLADSVMMQKYTEETGRLADEVANLVKVMTRVADGNEDRKNDKIAELMEQVREKLDGPPRRR